MALHPLEKIGSHITKGKAKEMLKNPPRGKPLSKKQKGLFGAVAGGNSTRQS